MPKDYIEEKKVFWECVYMEPKTRKIYAERFEATSATNAIIQLQMRLSGIVDNPIVLGVKPIIYGDDVKYYDKWIADARKFHSDIDKTIKEYERNGGVIE